MKRAELIQKGMFDFLEINKDNIITYKTDKLHKFILLENIENISIIKAIEKPDSNIYNNNNQISYNIFKTNKKEIEKNLKLYNGIIFIFNIEEKKAFINLYEYLQKIDKNIFKRKNYPKIIIGDKTEFEDFLKNDDAKHLKKMKKLKLLEPEPDKKISINKAVIEIIQIKKIYEQYNNFMDINNINEKSILNTFSKSKINLMKCLYCNQIYETSIDNNGEILLYCDNCLFKKKINVLDFETFEKTVNCYECEKKINENGPYNHCFKCKKNICNECTKKHIQKEDKSKKKNKNNNIIYPNNLVDLLCNTHEKICYNYCIECKRNICIDCQIEYHINHKTKIFDINKISKLIYNQKNNLEQEKENFKKMKVIVEDCIDSLTKFLNKLLLYREKEIHFKEKKIKELELFKFDNTLIENIKNLKFSNYDISTYNFDDTWEVKLNNIIELFNQPIKIENTKIFLEENIKGPFDILQTIDVTHRETPEENEKVTDICPLNNYKGKNHFAVSFNNGLLKIYNDEFENRIPINTIKVFEEKEEIIFLHKSFENFLLIVGISKIKRVYISQDLQDYKIINDIEIEDQIFKMALEIFSFNALLIVNNLNQIFFYYYSNGKFDISKDKEFEDGKDITFIDKITDNIIIFQFNNSNDLLGINLETESLTINCNEYFDQVNSVNMDTSSLLLINKNSTPIENVEIYWKIFEFEIKENNVGIKKSYQFKNELYYLGKVNEQSILLFNKKLKNIILFNLDSYSYILEIPFKSFHNPLIAFNLSRRKDIYDLLLINEEGYISQYSLNSKLKILFEIEKTKIGDKNCNKSNDENNIEIKNIINKTINLQNTFLFLTKENYIYKLKSSY